MIFNYLNGIMDISYIVMVGIENRNQCVIPSNKSRREYECSKMKL